MATLSKGLARLREQMNTTFPKRDTSSDGWIGDKAHAARKSDHNPDAKTGVVRALDLDRDFGPARSDNAQMLVDELVTAARLGKDRGRLAYVIYNGYIYSSADGFKRRKYTGTNAHKAHVHVSATKKADTDGTRWPLEVLTSPL